MFLIAPQDITAFRRQMKKAGFIQGKIKNQTIQPVSREEHIFHSTYSHQVGTIYQENGKCGISLCQHKCEYKSILGRKRMQLKYGTALIP